MVYSRYLTSVRKHIDAAPAARTAGTTETWVLTNTATSTASTIEAACTAIGTIRRRGHRSTTPSTTKAPTP